jgi:hypothetical protein
MHSHVKISFADNTSFLLVAVSLLGFSFVIPTARASSIMNDTITTISNGTATGSNTANITNTIELAEEPFAVGYYRTVSENTINETHSQFTFEGNTTLTLANATETIITRDTGQGNVTILPGDGVAFIRGQLQMTTENGSETATAEASEFLDFESSTGVGTAYFKTNSTEMLAPLNKMIGLWHDEIQPNGDSIVTIFEWKKGDGTSIDSNENSTATEFVRQHP